MRKAAAVRVVLLSVVLAGCADGGTSVSSGGPTTTGAADPAPATDLVDGSPLGDGSWNGARTTSDGDILVSFIGGKPYQEGNACTVGYSADATESDEEVRLDITARSPARPATATAEPVACTSEGYFRTLTVDLELPLGDRRLIEGQFDRVQPVFDGASLREPSALPEGWVQLSEGPGFPHPELSSSWSRTWGAASPPPVDGRCASAPAPVTLTQGPPAIVEAPAPHGERVVATHDVGGAEAAYAESDRANGRRLTWVADGIGFVLSSSDRCVGDPPTTAERLLEIARALI